MKVRLQLVVLLNSLCGSLHPKQGNEIRERMDGGIVHACKGVSSVEWNQICSEVHTAIPSTHCNEGNTNVISVLVTGLGD